MSVRILRRFRDMLDVTFGSPSDGDVPTYDSGTGKLVLAAPTGGGGGAPDDVNYLVGTASGDLSAEIVVGTSPGGELGGTWASPTVDATHSGSSHASVQSAAEATAASALSSHAVDTTGIHGISDTSALDTVAARDSAIGTHSADTTAVHGITDTSALALTANVQPLDSDLTAIAALTTTSFGRALLALADQAALLAAAGAAAASHAHAGEDITSGTVADARIAATIARDSEVAASYQPLDTDLTAIAALTTTTYGRSLLEAANAAALRTLAGVVIGTDVQAQDAELAAIAGLTSAANKGIQFTGSGTAATYDLTTAGKALLDDADAAAQLVTLGIAAAITATKIDDLTAGDDNTDLDASTSRHGLLQKLPGGTSTFLRADGSFATPAAGGAVATDAIFDAKGDLPVGTGADTAARLAVGANDLQLTADSTQTTGLKFATPSSLRDKYYRETSMLGETWPPWLVNVNNHTPLTGVLYLTAIALPAGLTIGHIAYNSGAVAAISPTHWWFGLYNSSRVQLALTADQTSTAWATNTRKSLVIATIASGASSTFTTTYEGLHYVGFLMTAGTLVTLFGASLPAGGLMLNAGYTGPITNGSSDTAQTTPPAFAHTANALTAVAIAPYATVSA